MRPKPFDRARRKKTDQICYFLMSLSEHMPASIHSDKTQQNGRVIESSVGIVIRDTLRINRRAPVQRVS